MKRNTMIHSEEEAILYSIVLNNSKECFNSTVNVFAKDFSTPCNFTFRYLITRWNLEYLLKGRKN
jgi:hypothetical protein